MPPYVLEIDYPDDPLAPLHALRAEPHIAALHSGVTGIPHARYSIFAASPTHIERAGWGHPDPAGLLRRLLPAPHPTRPPFFCGGWIGALGYELGRAFDTLSYPAGDAPPPALFWLAWYPAAIVLDHRRRRAFAAACPVDAHGNPVDARAAAKALALRIRHAPQPQSRTLPRTTGIEYEQSPSFYRDNVLAVREHLAAGDIYQANYTQRVRVAGRFDPAELFISMNEKNPAPFSACIDCGDHAVVSASPELFLHFDGRIVETRPIKGTAPRGMDPEEDLRRRWQLRMSEKDLAEHVMIVDLMRNDLKRACAPGTVHAEGILAVESYASVHHLVTTVRGRIAPGRTGYDLLAATFPGGSVTGAPRRRAMQIIAALEPCHRGVYTGALGWCDGFGRMCWNLPIRTLIVLPNEVHFSVGGGIVWDSDPDEEYEECRAKAAGLLWGLGLPREDGRGT